MYGLKARPDCAKPVKKRPAQGEKRLEIVRRVESWLIRANDAVICHSANRNFTEREIRRFMHGYHLVVSDAPVFRCGVKA